MAMAFRPSWTRRPHRVSGPRGRVLLRALCFRGFEFVLRYGLTLRGRGCRRTVDLGLRIGLSLIPFRLYSSSHGKSWSGDPPHAVIFSGRSEASAENSLVQFV